MSTVCLCVCLAAVSKCICVLPSGSDGELPQSSLMTMGANASRPSTQCFLMVSRMLWGKWMCRSHRNTMLWLSWTLRVNMSQKSTLLPLKSYLFKTDAGKVLILSKVTYLNTDLQHYANVFFSRSFIFSPLLCPHPSANQKTSRSSPLFSDTHTW